MTMKIEPKSKTIIREAKKAGRVVIATLESHSFIPGDYSSDSFRERRNRYLAIYVYRVNGRSYRYRRSTQMIPPETIELYYPKGNPKRAISESDTILGIRYIVICSIPLIVATILYHLIFKNIPMPEIDIMSIVPIAVGSVFVLFCILAFILKKIGR